MADRIVAQGERLIVFVDDFDRCLPERAIEVLEAIKLFLDVKGCIFLLGLDRDVVTRGIKVKYRGFAVDEGEGNDKRIPIDGAAYLEKIIQLPFRLPIIEPRAMQPFVHGLAAFPGERCEQVFAEGLETNPCKIKRAINVFLFISKLAEKRAIKLQSVRLAKIVVIYHSHSELYALLRLNLALSRDLEAYLQQQSEPREAEHVEHEDVVADRVVRTSLTRGANQLEAPVPARLLTDSLKRVLLLYLMDDDACFAKADYVELVSYFTLTRGTVVQTATVVAPTANVAASAFPPVVLTVRIPTFVTVPAGEFLMGTSDADIEQLLKMKETQQWAKEWKGKGRFNSEQPQHQVAVDEFQIAKCTGTNAQYQAFVQATKRPPPSHWSGRADPEEFAAHPVVNVTWDDAKAYCEWLTQQLRAANQLRENEIIRLPTEAEWEKAASWDEVKKEKRVYPWGNAWDTTKCKTAESGSRTTTPVGKYSPAGDSFYGSADRARNVWEWCADWYAEDYYKNSPDKNPTGPTSGQSRTRRGGSLNTVRINARWAYRGRRSPGSRHEGISFRVAESFLPAVGSIS